MSVDVFGRTTSAGDSTQIISRGISITQANKTFLRKDGENAATDDINLDSHKIINVGKPTNDKDVANKEYVDSNSVADNKVSKTGDKMTGDLIFTALHRDRIIGCTYLPTGKRFSLLVGNSGNRLEFKNSEEQSLLTVNTTRGLKIRSKTSDVCKIGSENNPPTIASIKTLK